jgi:tripartite-type tricarboxylate transporter receptor subunit TctC
MLVTPITNSAAGYSPADFTPVAMIGKTPMALVAKGRARDQYRG